MYVCIGSFFWVPEAGSTLCEVNEGSTHSQRAVMLSTLSVMKPLSTHKALKWQLQLLQLIPFSPAGKCTLSLVLSIWKLLAWSTGLSEVSFLFHFCSPSDDLRVWDSVWSPYDQEGHGSFSMMYFIQVFPWKVGSLLESGVPLISAQGTFFLFT